MSPCIYYSPESVKEDWLGWGLHVFPAATVEGLISNIKINVYCKFHVQRVRVDLCYGGCWLYQNACAASLCRFRHSVYLYLRENDS